MRRRVVLGNADLDLGADVVCPETFTRSYVPSSSCDATLAFPVICHLQVRAHNSMAHPTLNKRSDVIR